MEDKKSNGFLLFILGAAAGVALGYFLASDNKEEIIEDLKTTAKKVRDNLEEEIEKGKHFVEDLKHKVNEIIDKA